MTDQKDILVIMPVRDYKNIRADAHEEMLRVAAETTNPDLNARAEEFLKHAARVLGYDAFAKLDRHKLLEELKGEMKLWGLQLYTDANKIIDIVERNPVVLSLPLNRLLKVAPNSDKLFGFLADAIDSIVLRIVWNTPLTEVAKALSKAAAVGGLDRHPSVLGVMEVTSKDLPIAELKPYTYNYLDALIGNWVQTEQHLGPNSLRSAIQDNPPDSSAIPVKAKLDMLRKSNKLPFIPVTDVLKGMDKGSNVGDVVTAVFDSMILLNAYNWWSTTGRNIDWDERRLTKQKSTDVDTVKDPEGTVNIRNK